VRVLVLGTGYVGWPLACELARLGHEVFGLRRGSDATQNSQAAGVRLLSGDVTDLESLRTLPRDWDWVVNTVSSSKGGPEEYREVYLNGNRNVIEWLRGQRVRKYVYTSSTSVYGQSDGGAVDEQSPTEPESATSRILVETEQLLLDAARKQNFPAVILRVAGIYGPGRGHLFQQFLKSEAAIPGNGERFINMVHLQDVVGAIIAALEKGTPGEIYNVMDDEPVSYLDFFKWLSERLRKPMPPLVEERNRKRGVTNKRVSNDKLKRELAYVLKFPNFGSGYESEIAALTARKT
jgi:nucleoside-diphosphate-sugar epimerase